MNSFLRLAGVEKESIVNGPGLRYTIFAQGCPHHCLGCHNQQTWDLQGGYLLNIEEIFQEIKENCLLQGVTFTGGEPLLQATLLAKLGEKIKEIGLNLMVYTGYTWERIKESNDEGIKALLNLTDILVDGPFILAKKDLALPFRGSSNQRLIDVPASLKKNCLVLVERTKGE